MHDKLTCFYPLFNLPPSVFHFNTAIVLSQKENIGGVIVIIPDIKNTYLDQDQCFKLWQLYRTSYPMMDIRVELTNEQNTFQEIKKRFSKDPSLSAYIAVDEKTARSTEFNTAFHGFDKMEVELVPSNFEKTSKKMRDAIEQGDKETFLKYVPESLTDEHKEDCWRAVHQEIEEQIIDQNFWKKVLLEYLPLDKN